MKLNLLFLFASLIVVGCAPSDKQNDSRPNVILIMTDDQGYGDLAAHGNPWIKTPEMDRLHSESIRLTNFHVGTTCAPTRSGLLTGRNCNEVGVWHTIIGRNFLRQGEVTIADLLREEGYRTGIFGKWHLGDNYPYRPEDRGFDEALIHGGGGVGQTPDYWNNDYFDDTYFRNGVPEKFEGYCTDVWFNEAMKFIDESKDKPFFCYIATNAPHGPFHVPQNYLDMYKDVEEIPNPNFYGMITNVDDNLGKLRNKLDESGLTENTILIFLTDNGTAAGIQQDRSGFKNGKGFNVGMRGKKGSAYEGGHRVPFFIHWPVGKLNSGQDIDFITSYTDVVPTLLDLCGVESRPELPFEGESLVALLNNPQDSWKQRTIITDTQRKEFLEKWKDASIMTDQYRLIRGEELYDIKKDPGQATDIAEQHPDVVASLRQEYEQWWTRVSQRSDEINPIPVGFDDSVVTLTCHDIHADDGASPAWNQNQVRLNRNPNGFWVIDVAEEGKYEITLNRYPAEAEAGFNAIVPQGQEVSGGKPYPVGVPIDVQSASVTLTSNDEQSNLMAEGSGQLTGKGNVKIELDLKTGEQKIRTTLFDAQGEEFPNSAYYVYIRKV